MVSYKINYAKPHTILDVIWFLYYNKDPRSFMQAPISPVVKKILADESKSREFMSKLLQSGRETAESIIEVDGKRYIIRKTASIPAP